MRIFNDIEQGSPEWFSLRAGMVSASEFSSVLAKGEGKTRAKYLRRVVAERLTGQPSENFSNAHTDRGQAQEPLARIVYEDLTDTLVKQVGFVQHDERMIGCSPDGLLPDRGVEIKSVIPSVQVETILRGGYPPEHKAQIQGGLWLTGLKAWDFVSYCPAMPEHLRCYVFTVERDETYIETLRDEVMKFDAEADRIVAQLTGMRLQRAA